MKNPSAATLRAMRLNDRMREYREARTADEQWLRDLPKECRRLIPKRKGESIRLFSGWDSTEREIIEDRDHFRVVRTFNQTVEHRKLVQEEPKRYETYKQEVTNFVLRGWHPTKTEIMNVPWPAPKGWRQRAYEWLRARFKGQRPPFQVEVPVIVDFCLPMGKALTRTVCDKLRVALEEVDKGRYDRAEVSITCRSEDWSKFPLDRFDVKVVPVTKSHTIHSV